MRSFVALVCGVGAALFLPAAAPMSDAAQAESLALNGSFKITMSGGDDVTFSGVCVLTRADGYETRQIVHGAGPSEYKFRAVQISCEILAEGPLVVEIASPSGNLSRTNTSGGLLKFSQT